MISIFSFDYTFNNWPTSNAAFRSCVLISLYQNTQTLVQCTDIDKNQQKYCMNRREKGVKVIKKKDKKVVRSGRKLRIGLMY